MNVKVLTHTPNPERAIVTAARICYSNQTGEDMYESLTEKEVKNMIVKLRESGHFATFEHASITFAISGVSRALTHQLVRHRLASFNQQSQRYVNMNDFEYVLPNTIKHNSESKEIFETTITMLNQAYSCLIDLGIPKEDARYLLPNACCSNINVTMNARELIHFFELRCCARAQWEIKELANKMLDECRKIAPLLFEKVGASCEAKGICPEGTMTCGRINNVKN